MPKTIEDINKSFSKVCENCIYQQHCPYQDKSACIELITIIMTQKVIANIYKRQITKTYNENGEYICNFILEYRDEKDERHLMNVFVNNFEPYIDKDVVFYLAEVEVYSKQNVVYNSSNLYLNYVKCISLVPLRSDEDIRNAKESIYRHYGKNFK